MLRSFWLLPLVAAYFGGWAAITVEDLPDYVVAGQPTNLTFTVRQHGFTRLSGLNPRIEARSGGVSADATASAGREAGQYVATLILPSPGEWTITINSGFGNSRVTLLPVPAIAAGARAPVPLAESERGRHLFVAKGCVTCHVHGDVAGSGMVRVGPDLTGRHLAADYLRQWLSNPATARKSTSSAQMPNLDLKPAEIAALVAFINADRRGA